jgi:hypothetical protein
MIYKREREIEKIIDLKMYSISSVSIRLIEISFTNRTGGIFFKPNINAFRVVQMFTREYFNFFFIFKF